MEYSYEDEIHDRIDVARLCTRLLHYMHKRVPAWMQNTARHGDDDDGRSAKKLNSLVQNVFKGEIPEKPSREFGEDVRQWGEIRPELVTWWETYRNSNRDKEIRARALAKLDPEERRVLGWI